MVLTEEERRIRHRARCKRYREQNKEKCAAYGATWRDNNREKVKEDSKKYYQANREKAIKRMTEYAKTPKGKKVRAIARWKIRGVISNDYDKLYENYMNTKCCENCDQEFGPHGTPENNWRCLDHCHVTGEFRQVLCNMCNILRG